MEMAATESKMSSKSMKEPEVLFIPECKEKTSQTAWYETLKDGFWQVALDDNRADLCTINTQFERYRFNCLPFGIASAPEIFQRKCLEAFGDIVGVQIYFDDLIIYGKDEVSHDLALNR